MPTNEAWLGLVREDALEPDRPIIDPHHHLWDHAGSRYLLDELLSDTGTGHRVVATVFVECMSMYRVDGPEAMRPVGETEFVNGIAAQSARSSRGTSTAPLETPPRSGRAVKAGARTEAGSPLEVEDLRLAPTGQYGPTRVAAGIVGFADLTLGDKLDEVLEAHVAAAPARFRGIRHAAGFDPHDEIRNSHTNPPKGLLGMSRFRDGVRRLARHRLTFDAWLYHHQIPELTELARACPEVGIVLDHFGGPLGIGPYAGKRAEIFGRWKKDIADLARCPNVAVKLGGINMAVNGFGWHRRDRPPTSEELVGATGDYYFHTIDCFGPDRCMFESNFPVDKLSCSYGVLWNAFKRMAQRFSAAERSALFHDTAFRVYRLGSR